MDFGYRPGRVAKSAEPAVLDALTHQVQSLLPAVSFVGSVASVGVTGYFWLVKMNRERPRLLIEGVEHLSFVDLGPCEGDIRTLCFRQGLVVVNESSLPTAVLGVAVRARSRAGGWAAADGIRPAPGSAIPLNLPPFHSGLVTLDWETAFPYDAAAEALESPDRVIAAYLEAHWAVPGQLTVEVREVRGRVFAADIPLRGSRMASTVRLYLDRQAA
jgi:hypothetical protein